MPFRLCKRTGGPTPAAGPSAFQRALAEQSWQAERNFLAFRFRDCAGRGPGDPLFHRRLCGAVRGATPSFQATIDAVRTAPGAHEAPERAGPRSERRACASRSAGRSTNRQLNHAHAITTGTPSRVSERKGMWGISLDHPRCWKALSNGACHRNNPYEMRPSQATRASPSSVEAGRLPVPRTRRAASRGARPARTRCARQGTKPSYRAPWRTGRGNCVRERHPHQHARSDHPAHQPEWVASQRVGHHSRSRPSYQALITATDIPTANQSREGRQRGAQQHERVLMECEGTIAQAERTETCKGRQLEAQPAPAIKPASWRARARARRKAASRKTRPRPRGSTREESPRKASRGCRIAGARTGPAAPDSNTPGRPGQTPSSVSASQYAGRIRSARRLAYTRALNAGGPPSMATA